MRRPLALFALCLATVAVAGCNGGSPAAPVPQAPQARAVRPPWWREAPDTVRSGVYVAQANGSGDGLVLAYPAQNKANKAPECSITGQSFQETQIAADSTGNLYLPNVATGTVNIYAPHCGNLLRAVPDPNRSDLSVAVDGAKFYAAGGTHVSICSMNGCAAALTDNSILQLESVAVDHSGNVWASYYNQGARPSLIVWVGATMPGRVVNGYDNQNTPGGLLFDRRNTLISVQTRFTHVYVYHCNAGTASCINAEILSLHGPTVFGTLNAKNTAFQATDYANDSVDVYAYPSFRYKYSYSNGLNQGDSVEGIVETR